MQTIFHKSPPPPPPPPPPMKCLRYNSRLHLVLRFQFWISEENKAPLHCHYFLFPSFPKWQYLLRCLRWIKWIDLQIIHIR